MFAMLLLLVPLSGFAQAGTEPTVKQMFDAMESKAPKGYPTLFVVTTSSVSPSTFMGSDGGCVMNIETFGKVYFVTGASGWHGCKSFQPGTVLWGRVHRVLGTVVDILDAGEGKPKSLRYTVQDISLVDPETQRIR